jgi:hypothetical protein
MGVRMPTFCLTKHSGIHPKGALPGAEGGLIGFDAKLTRMTGESFVMK